MKFLSMKVDIEEKIVGCPFKIYWSGNSRLMVLEDRKLEWVSYLLYDTGMASFVLK